MSNNQNATTRPTIFTRLFSKRGKWITLIVALFLVAVAALLPETLLHAAPDRSVLIEHRSPRHPTLPTFSASPVNITFNAHPGQKNLPAQVVTLKNNSETPLYWRNSLTALSSGVIGAAPSGGTIAPGKTAQVRVLVNTRRLGVGTYTFKFNLLGFDAENKAVTGSPIEIKVHVTRE